MRGGGGGRRVQGEPLSDYFGTLGDALMTMMQARVGPRVRNGRRLRSDPSFLRTTARGGTERRRNGRATTNLNPKRTAGDDARGRPTNRAARPQVLTLDGWITGLARPLGHTVGWKAWAFFLTFMLLGSLGFLNLMTAVFVNTLLEVGRAATFDRTTTAKQERRAIPIADRSRRHHTVELSDRRHLKERDAYVWNQRAGLSAC